MSAATAVLMRANKKESMNHLAAAAVSTLAALVCMCAAAASASAAPVLEADLRTQSSEAQFVKVHASGGTFRLNFGTGGPAVSQTADLPTDPPNVNVGAAQVEAALNSLANVSAGGGSVSVESFELGIYVVTFDGGPLRYSDVPELSGVPGSSPLTGGSQRVSVRTAYTAGIFRGDQSIRYEVLVKNIGPDMTSGDVNVELTLPEGVQTSFGSVANNGLGWECSAVAAVGATPAVVSCAADPALGPGETMPAVLSVTVPVDGATTAGGQASVEVSGGGAAATATDTHVLEFEPAKSFGIQGLSANAFGLQGSDYTQAGGHPFEASLAATPFTLRGGSGQFASVELVRDVFTDLPDGFVGNPLAIPVLCPSLADVLESACPVGSSVGEISVDVTFGTGDIGNIRMVIYAIEPERGAPAQFAFAELANLNSTYTVVPRLRADNGYSITLEASPSPGSPPLRAINWATICTYGAEITDGAGSQNATFVKCNEASDLGANPVPLSTNPTSCSQAPTTRLSINSWEHPTAFKSAEAVAPDLTGCSAVPFTPSSSVALTSSTRDSASGLEAEISVPDDGLTSPNGVSQAQLKKTVVELPAGVAANPSGATGLAGCSDAQLGLGTDVEPSCPDGSVIGTVTATTPVLEEAVTGEMVLRTPRSTDPMSGEMLRMALVVRNKERGILVKLPGSATADPQTGRLTATFDDNPQLPIGNVNVKVKGGSRGMLATPQGCGDVMAKTTLAPWASVDPVTSETVSPISGDSCTPGFTPKLAAGMSTQKARGNGTFSFRLTRPQGDQTLSGLTARLPLGLLASVNGVPLCKSADAEAGTCPAGSRIGTVDASAGSGDPFVLEEKGEAFLTEGYKGGAYGLAVKVRGIAGPFRGAMELSPIVVRQAIHVDPRTAEVTAVSDPFPQIHHGIPLRVREVTVLVDRDKFMLNPSDCSQEQVDADVVSANAAVAGLSTPFQATGCAALPFKPKIALALTGRKQTTTGKHPGVKATVTQTGVGEAGFEKAVVRLPKSLALDPNNAQALCEFTDGTKPDLDKRCPKGSIVGRARATSPLLNRPLVGNVYFVKNIRTDPTTGNQIRTLPMIIVALRGEIAVNLKGESSTTNSGKLVNTFNDIPDAPIDKFNLNIKGGNTGIIAITRTRKAKINLCAGRHTAQADTDGQNGRTHDFDIRIKTPCTKQQVKRTKRAAATARK